MAGITQRAEKYYFHCGSQAEKETSSNQNYLWKEILVIKRDNSDNSNNSDNDKDNMSDNDNNNNM